MDEEMICEKPKKLEDMSYEELLERQKREEDFYLTYRTLLAQAVIEYEYKKTHYIENIDNTVETLKKIQDLLYLKQPHKKEKQDKSY